MNAPEKCPKCNMGGITDEGQPSNRWHYGCGTYVYCDEDGLEVAYTGDLCDARMEIAEIKKERDEARDTARWLYQHGIATLVEGASRNDWIKEQIK